MTIRPALVLVLSSAALFALVGCQGNGQTDAADPLANSAWTLNVFGDKALPEGVTVTARFVDGRVDGLAGCNRYFASYEVKGDSLHLGPVGRTKMMCPDPQMAVEESFLAAMGQPIAFRLGSDGLTLANDKIALSFTSAPLDVEQK